MTGVALLLVASIGLYWLHALWRLIASGDGIAQGAFVAAFFLLAVVFKTSLPEQPMVPIWLPFIYPYSWAGATALLWVLARVRVDRRGLSFPGASPLLSAYLLSQLAMHVGFAALGQWLAWRPLAAYALLPPLMALVGYASYRLMLTLRAREDTARFGWWLFATVAIASPLIAGGLGQWLVPVALRYG
ncbi:hypothetical protein Ga0061063_2194 [Gulbenkiania indica]|uniref:Uncharacterized protein n=1 Tax=Gulbenkiania indica TaxID=375574 RepID=A0A0K6H1D3_9NEIS|nr:hypothetical protein [Gulbenkiania indica]CUA84798.1 hypothetical protein Ga0061063_2194 [Gulbenkiania indica]